MTIAAAGAFIVVVAAGVAALAWRGSSAAMHPASSDAAPEDEAPASEAVVVESSTGARLAGRFYRGRSGATVILSHGYGGTLAELRQVRDALHREGLSVFAYDLRGCGASTGSITFGALEARDLRSVVDHLAGRRDVDATRLGAYGFSMGGATTLLAAAEDTRLRAVVSDSGWADVRHWLRPSLRGSLRRPHDRFSLQSLRLVELRTGIDLGKLRPGELVGRIGARPLLLLHGDADDVVPVADARALAERAGSGAQLWIVRGGRHGDSLAAHGAASSQRVTDFFRQSLAVEAAA